MIVGDDAWLRLKENFLRLSLTTVYLERGAKAIRAQKGQNLVNVVFNDPISLQVRYLGIKKLEEEACKFKEPLTTTEIHSATTETDHNNHGDQVRGHS